LRIGDSASPIRATPKPKCRRKSRNVFYDDRGFPDQSNDFDHLLHNIDGGVILRKKKHPQPSLDIINPTFNYQFNATLHAEKLKSELLLEHLSPADAASVVNLIKHYWTVFDNRGRFTPIQSYECAIDTGTAAPISIKMINYGTREMPIMQKCIAVLAKVGQIVQIHDGRWLFKALLAAKPHQEHVSNIDDFVWHFCVNYIPLNQVTRLIAFPISRCDMAVGMAFGSSKFLWMYDAPMGYHQLSVSLETQEKLAFQGPDAIKWTYTVMPFGPTNGPATFIQMIHNLDSAWKALAEERRLTIDDDTNTNIIINDIFNWAKTFREALLYMECQLQICRPYRLSLSLKKSHFFPTRFEFVDINVSADGNRPAMSKHDLLRHWPIPEFVRDIASFVGFLQFYSNFIPHFEVRALPLCEIMKREYTKAVGDMWTADANRAFNELKQSVLGNPCLCRLDHRKLTVLRTDFSALGFGYVVCQPGDDECSLAKTSQYMSGNGFGFMTKDGGGILYPVAFGSRRTRGNEKRLHSYLGEGFAGDWAINKICHMCFGRRFVWVTNCYTAKFILSYDGLNPAILRLQMHLMCWDVDIVHRTNKFLVDADYWSRLNANLCYDPTFREYLQFISSFRATHPPPTAIPMQPENMPYYRGPRVRHPDDLEDANAVVAAESLLTTIVAEERYTPPCLANYPVRFGEFTPPTDAAIRHLYNLEFPALAF
jgi:hypothetical protein